MTPQTLYTDRASKDVDEHATHLSGWLQEYDQLSCGRFEGHVRELWVAAPRLQVFHEHTGQRTSQRCLPWRGAIWFGIPDGQGGDGLHFAGRLQPVERDRIMMSARADDGFVLRTPKHFGIYGVVVDEAWLGTELARLGLSAPSMSGASVRAASLQPHAHVALCQTIETMLSLGASQACGQAWGRAALQALTDQLLMRLVGAQDGSGGSAQWQSNQRRLTAVMAARSLVAQPHNHTVSVNDLCSELHLTPRTLQNHFQQVVGESPAEFLRAVRLNACRRKLRAPAGGATVQDVAAQWGFFHMGRFSQAYKAMFGELPSHTLRTARLAH